MDANMKKQCILLMAASALMLAACGNGGGKAGTDAGAAVAVQEEDNIIHKLPVLHVEDTCRVGGNAYAWEIERMACDSLGVVMDDMGFRYADNTLRVVLRRNGGVLYARTFTKSDFKHLLDRDFYSKSILDGCRFLQVREGTVSFLMAVSYPESDMSQPFQLDIAPDGITRLVKTNIVEDEYLPDSLLQAGGGA